jgi:hypothetical protein
MCPSGGPGLPIAKLNPARDFTVPAGSLARKLHINATLRYRKIDQFLLNYTMGENSGLTAPVVDIASATADVCVARDTVGAACREAF